MVGANTFRNPALVAKMVTTLDHISGGRAVLGIGGAWFETEHTAFGLPFGSGPGERLRWLAEALPIMRGMLDGSAPSIRGERYATEAPRNVPPPLQDHLPILVGGTGPKVTLRLVAQYADACNVGGSAADEVAGAEARLLEHCAAVGRDEIEVERTVGMGVPVIRDAADEAHRVFADIFARNGGARPWTRQPVGTVEQVVEHCAAYLAVGYRHLIFGFPSPYDEETMTRLATEVRPLLAAKLAG
jgi:alkanesulfonate monooxygenase SsuD/methylene tetrahydromethanopterin reductase-like flavin-dependent oxidoreductase (luciferase family)